MKKRKKRIIIIGFFIIILSIGVVLFFNSQVGDDKLKATEKIKSFSSRTFSDLGIVDGNNHRFTFTDVASGERIFLCDKPNCLHEDRECNAYIDKHIDAPTIYMDRFLYLVYEDWWTCLVYGADINGGNRRKLVNLGDIQHARDLVYMNNHILIGYGKSFIYEEGHLTYVDKLDKDISGVVMVDLDTYNATYITEKSDYSASFEKLHLYENKLYYVYIYQDVEIDFMDIENFDWRYSKEHTFSRIYSYDLETGIETCIYEDQAIGNIEITDKYALILDDSQDIQRIYSFDLINFEKKLLVEENKRLNCYSDGNRVIYFTIDPDDNSLYSFYYYDLVLDKSFYIGMDDKIGTIEGVVDDYIYLGYTNEAGVYVTGSMKKDDFYKGDFHKIIEMHILE